MGSTITHVLGARPNFVKAAPVIRAVRARPPAAGGAHRAALRRADVRRLLRPARPARAGRQPGRRSGTQARQTADVLVGMERKFPDTPPSLVVVYGDVNSTVGAALAGAKLGVPLAHVEAGLRSFDNTMPEEINRRLTDRYPTCSSAPPPRRSATWRARAGRTTRCTWSATR